MSPFETATEIMEQYSQDCVRSCIGWGTKKDRDVAISRIQSAIVNATNDELEKRREVEADRDRWMSLALHGY